MAFSTHKLPEESDRHVTQNGVAVGMTVGWHWRVKNTFIEVFPDVTPVGGPGSPPLWRSLSVPASICGSDCDSEFGSSALVDVPDTLGASLRSSCFDGVISAEEYAQTAKPLEDRCPLESPNTAHLNDSSAALSVASLNQSDVPYDPLPSTDITATSCPGNAWFEALQVPFGPGRQVMPIPYVYLPGVPMQAMCNPVQMPATGVLPPAAFHGPAHHDVQSSSKKPKAVFVDLSRLIPR